MKQQRQTIAHGSSSKGEKLNNKTTSVFDLKIRNESEYILFIQREIVQVNILCVMWWRCKIDRYKTARK